MLDLPGSQGVAEALVPATVNAIFFAAHQRANSTVTQVKQMVRGDIPCLVGIEGDAGNAGVDVWKLPDGNYDWRARCLNGFKLVDLKAAGVRHENSIGPRTRYLCQKSTPAIRFIVSVAN